MVVCVDYGVVIGIGGFESRTIPFFFLSTCKVTDKVVTRLLPLQFHGPKTKVVAR